MSLGWTSEGHQPQGSHNLTVFFSFSAWGLKVESRGGSSRPFICPLHGHCTEQVVPWPSSDSKGHTQEMCGTRGILQPLPLVWPPFSHVAKWAYFHIEPQPSSLSLVERLASISRNTTHKIPACATHHSCAADSIIRITVVQPSHVLGARCRYKQGQCWLLT